MIRVSTWDGSIMSMSITWTCDDASSIRARSIETAGMYRFWNPCHASIRRLNRADRSAILARCKSVAWLLRFLMSKRNRCLLSYQHHCHNINIARVRTVIPRAPVPEISKHSVIFQNEDLGRPLPGLATRVDVKPVPPKSLAVCSSDRITHHYWKASLLSFTS